MNSWRYTQHGEIVGSPYYMSPEQAAGKVVSPASDIYCLGVIFYEMVTGKRPYVADRMEALLQLHIEAPPPRFESKFSEFQGLLDRTMHKDPTKRFPSASSVVDYITSQWPTVVRLMGAHFLLLSGLVASVCSSSSLGFCPSGGFNPTPV